VTEIMRARQATVGRHAGSKRAAMRLSSIQPHRPSAVLPIAGKPRASSFAAVALLAAGAVACTAPAEDVTPPDDQFSFPTAIGITPDDAILFVANANAELQYDSGTILAVDLDTVDSVANGWTGSGIIPPNSGCTQDPDHVESLICDEKQFLRPNAGTRIGNFATDLAVQDTGGGNFRLIVPVRGDPSITWIDWNGTSLDCADGAQGFAECDDAHRLTAIHNDTDIGLLPEEPFNAFVDSAGQYAVVTHLTTGDVTLLDTQPGKDAEIADVAVGVFEPDQTTGLTGATGVAGRTPGMPDDMVYVGSRDEDRIQMFTIGRPVNNQLPFLIMGNWFFLDFVGGNAGLSSDSRGMTFSDGGTRMYEVNRDPPTLQIVDTSAGADGFPQNKGVAASDICRQASEVTVMDSGDGERAYLTCFEDGQVYVIDPRGNSTLDDVITVGRGPYAIAAAPTRKKIYVSNFLEDTIAVIDTTPGSPNRNRVVLRVGVPLPASDTSSGDLSGSASI
jgi:DNA-binding beta-propeller fold protein YncE